MSRPIALEDFRKLKLVSDPQIAPDGSQVACVVKRIESDKNRYSGEIWVVPYPPTEGQPRRFTASESGASHPRWSPDGRSLAFLSNRQKPLSQIYILPADGGEARPLTKLTEEGSIGEFRWSPDGRWIAFTFTVTPEVRRKSAVDDRNEKGLSSPVRHHTRLFYRLDGVGYFDDAYPHVWVADTTTGEAHPLTSGPHFNASLTWSPDSSTLAFLADRREDQDIAPAHQTIYTLPVAAFISLFSVPSGTNASTEGAKESTQEKTEEKTEEKTKESTQEKTEEKTENRKPEIVLNLVPTPPGHKESLAWSPDGRYFAYAGNLDPLDTWGTNNERIFLLPVEGGDTAQDLTGHTDWTVGYMTLSDSHELGGCDLVQWSADNNSLYFPASVRGDTYLCRVDVASQQVTPLTAEGEVGSYAVRGERIVVVRGTATTPHSLFALVPSDPAQHGASVQMPLAEFNSDWCHEIRFGQPETLEIDNGDGGTLHGWLLKPTEFRETEKYPLVVYVHGGPHTQYGDTLMHEFQLLAAQGYVVLYTNPRGSKGYGEAHTKAIFGNWGSVDFKDIMTATDYAVALPYVDAGRTAIMGGSYGGFMTAWAIGHTDRYRCAIADRLVANLQSMSGTCDFPWRPNTYYAGNGWSDPAKLWSCSPLAHAGNIRTPLLLIHSDGDLRCPAGQAEEMFAALRLQRKTVEYVRFPADASHGLSRSGPPDLRQERLEHNLAWLERYLK